ncbi:MAG: SprT-like domain-containing protein [Nanoarchaeota archaeon]|nr:SprT-like domain-containing protein [Nanoarchaeota archaeon]
MIQRAYQGLFPLKRLEYQPQLKYSHAFKGYNGNIRVRGNLLEVRMGHDWKDVSEEIQIGLIQVLLLKLFRKKATTNNIDMYNSFIKNMSKFAQVHKSDPDLEESFVRINDEYFNGLMDRPNLVWGGSSFFKLGSYDYSTNTITISRILADDQNLLDYVVYHELLHKKLKFHSKNGRSYHHTKEFKDLEKKYKDPDAEEKLQKLIVKKKVKKMLKFW